VQGDLARYGLDEAELARRKAFVGGVRQQIQSLRAQGTMQEHVEHCDCWKLASVRLDQWILSAKHALTGCLSAAGPVANGHSTAASMRESLLGNTRSQREGDRARANAVLEEENDAFIDNEGMRRALIQREQDEVCHPPPPSRPSHPRAIVLARDCLPCRRLTGDLISRVLAVLGRPKRVCGADWRDGPKHSHRAQGAGAS
jgi:hypothetical protein